ncbi:MAG: hypothetical protein P1P64_02955 [Treponemataceae bacterium]
MNKRLSSVEIDYYPRDSQYIKKAFQIAFVTRPSVNFYKIYINDVVEDEVYECAELHEKGHILYNHLQGMELYKKQFEEELNKIWNTKMTKFFEPSLCNDPEKKKQIVNILFNKFSNIAMDMEINSKLFVKMDWLLSSQQSARAFVLMYLQEVVNAFDDNGNLKYTDVESKEYKSVLRCFNVVRNTCFSRIYGDEGQIKFCHPRSKGWLSRLDWITYMLLLVQDFDKTMEQVVKDIKQEIGEVQKINGQKIGDQDNGSQDNGSQDNGKITGEILDKYQDLLDDIKDALHKDGVKTKDTDTTSTNKNSRRKNRGTKSDRYSKLDFEFTKSSKEFVKLLEKLCLGKQNKRLVSDILYNSNRRKFSGDVVIPRRYMRSKWIPQKACFLIDISSSVDTVLVERVVSSIIQCTQGLDLKRSRIIYCDTDVREDLILSKRLDYIPTGGGTIISKGIKYINKKNYCKNRNDKLFIVSDLYDSLDEWVKEGEKLKCEKYVIGYNQKNTDGVNKLFDNYLPKRLKDKWAKEFKTFFVNFD